MIGRPQISKRRTVFGTLLVGGGSANRRAHGKHVTRLVWLLDPKPGQQKGGRRGVARGIMPSLVAEACSILGIEAGPSGVPDEEVIASAFKKLAIKWHPDRNPENVKEATQRFAEISAARDLLLDPPTNALLDEPRGAGGAGAGCADPYPKTAHSKSMRTFEGDVTDAIASGEFGGKEAVSLFESFGLWAVYKCDVCEAVCCRIRKNKYSCMCGHRLRDHDAGNKFRCADLKCRCKRFEFMVQDTDQPHKCRCKHAPQDHDPEPPYACKKCGDCAAFDSPWTCNCGHAPKDHRTAFVRHKYTERTREWVAGGLRGECVAMAKKFRSRSMAERISFIQRANAAKAAGFPSWKAMQKEMRAHEKYGTSPVQPGAPHQNGAAPDISHGAEAAAAAVAPGPCGECDPDPSSSAAAGVSGLAGLAGMAAGSATSTAEQRTAATKAGFRPGNETTHGLSTEELRERLAAAGVGVRAATAADFGAPGLW